MTRPVVTTAISQTNFQPAAIPQLLDLWQQVMPGDAPDQARFRDIALLDPAFQPDGLTLLWRDERLIGFCYAVAAPAPANASRPRRGWLVGLGVAADERRAGHGTRLLDSCLQFLAGTGCSVAELGGNGERYLLPGADATAYPEFRRLIKHAGFHCTGSTAAMTCDLRESTSFAQPRDDQTYQYRHPADGDIPQLLRVIDGFSASWSGLVRSYLARAPDAANLWVAHDQDAIVGFAGADLFPGCPGRFGPMGVVPAVRGRGVGGTLLRLALTSMAARGRPSAWFLWAPEGAAGLRMYTTAGFRVNRQFEFFSRDLQAPVPRRTWHEGSTDE